MELFGFVSIGLVIVLFVFSIYLMLKPKHEPFMGFDKRWICLLGIAALLLSTVFFYMAGYQTNNLVQTLTVNGVDKTFTINTLDLPGASYFQLVNALCFIGVMFFILGAVREIGIFGTTREGHRRNTRY